MKQKLIHGSSFDSVLKEAAKAVESGEWTYLTHHVIDETRYDERLSGRSIGGKHLLVVLASTSRRPE